MQPAYPFSWRKLSHWFRELFSSPSLATFSSRSRRLHFCTRIHNVEYFNFTKWCIFTQFTHDWRRTDEEISLLLSPSPLSLSLCLSLHLLLNLEPHRSRTVFPRVLFPANQLAFQITRNQNINTLLQLTRAISHCNLSFSPEPVSALQVAFSLTHSLSLPLSSLFLSLAQCNVNMIASAQRQCRSMSERCSFVASPSHGPWSGIHMKPLSLAASGLMSQRMVSSSCLTGKKTITCSGDSGVRRSHHARHYQVKQFFNCLTTQVYLSACSIKHRQSVKCLEKTQ